ncbi:vicilin-like seed storage protein At2g18540 [Triticum aestivum]|uniref:vicilin-like seed storage protein At2g18540 n=1 Tax=Triticum aestivum TaxID=4565 RepID=UPI001D02B809|nr:vicilin-like seed storage protein At2g18540 [Triticum aestivum]
MNQVGQRPPPPVPESRPPPPTGSWIRILRSVASSLGLSLRSLMVLLWRACRLPAGQDEEERNDAKNKNETGGQDDEDRLKKTEIAARKRARQKAKKAARKEAKAKAKAVAEAKAKKTKKEAKAEDKKKRQEEEAMKRKEEEEAAKEEARIREEEQKAAKEKARQKLAEDKKKADLEEAKRRQREDAERRKEEARMEEEDRQRRREEAQRRKEADRNKDEYEIERDAHRSFWDKNLSSLEDNGMTLCMVCHFDPFGNKGSKYGCTDKQKDRHIGNRHKAGVEHCKKPGCFVIAKDKSRLGKHHYYCHGISK